MNRTLALALLLLSGCQLHWKQDAAPEPTGSEITTAAEEALRGKARMMADVARKVAAKVRAGEFKEYADVEAFEGPLNKAAVPDYEPLRNAQDARLKRDEQGNLRLSDPEADAKVWEETAEGFDKVAKGSK